MQQYKTIKMSNDRVIKTVTGKLLDVFNPDPDLICAEDMSQGLSNECRFGGQTKTFHSVAEHSIWMAERAEPQDKIACLFHDGSEGLGLRDLPKPIKRYLLEYQEIEFNLMKAIAMKFGFEYPVNERVKELDRLSFEYERDNKLNANTFVSMTPEQANARFMELYHEIMQEQNNLITINE